jgi:hypothetical protein
MNRGRFAFRAMAVYIFERIGISFLSRAIRFLESSGKARMNDEAKLYLKVTLVCRFSLTACLGDFRMGQLANVRGNKVAAIKLFLRTDNFF